MDARLQRIKDLIEQKEQVDAELESLIGGAPLKQSKTRACSICGGSDHNSRSCPTKKGGEDGRSV